MIASLAFAMIAVLLLRACDCSRHIRYVAAFFTCLVLLLSGVHAVSDYFTGRGIDESVIYHLEYGLDGAGFTEYSGIIATAVVFAVVMLSLSYLVFYYVSRGSISASKSARSIGVGMFLVAVAINPASKNLFSLYAPSLNSSAIATQSKLPDFYVESDVAPVSSTMNIVYIYLESLERTYFDEGLFPGLVPGLKELEKKSLSFTNIEGLENTGWTIAGMTATQCGIPLVTPDFERNSMGGMDKFLPGALCMGDLLKKEGYALTYMGGASLEFAGKGKFFKTHGFVDVRGRDAAVARLDNSTYKTAWGVYDDTLFQQAYRRFVDLSRGSTPFGLFMLTLDTHHPNGHPSASCDSRSYRDGANPIFNAVYCTDFTASEFVRKIRESEYSDNTLIVISSDHLAMRNSAYSILNKRDRKNLFMVLPPEETHALIEKRGSTLDVGPTFLSMMGFDVAKLGFGRDLMRDDPSLVEAYPNANKFLRSTKQFLAALWGYPKLNGGLLVDLRNNHVRLGDRVVNIPVLFVLDDSPAIKEIRFGTGSAMLIDHVIGLDQKEPMVWIDSCSKVSLLASDVSFAGMEGYCIAVGRLEVGKFLVKAIDDIALLKKEDLSRIIADARVDSTEYAKRIKRLRIEKYGKPVMVNGANNKSGSFVGNLIIRSVGGHANGQSIVMSVSEAVESPLEEMPLERGLSLVGMKEDSRLVKLAHVDPCLPDHPVMDSASISGSFSDLIGGFGDRFSAYLIVAHDSAKCGSTFDFGKLFDDLPLNKWRDIGFRQGYIGVIGSDGNVYEKLGSTDEEILVNLLDFIPQTHSRASTRSEGKPAMPITDVGAGRAQANPKIR